MSNYKNDGLIIPTNSSGEALEVDDQLTVLGRELNKTYDKSEDLEKYAVVVADSAISVFDEEGAPVPQDHPVWKDIFDDLVARGIIKEDKDAPPCMGCREKLEAVHVRVVSSLDGIKGDVWAEDDFEWVPGLDQFNVSPSFFGAVAEGWATFEATCGKCGEMVPDLEITYEPHGLIFGAASRMAGAL